MSVASRVETQWRAAVDRTGAPGATALVAVMVAVATLQQVLLPALGVPKPVLQRAFYFHTNRPAWLWAVATSAVAHGGFLHLVINVQLVLGFGSIIEPDYGTGPLLAAFAAGALGALGAGFALQTAIGGAESYVGSSGGAFGMLGWLAGQNPQRSLPTVPPGPVWAIAALVCGVSVGVVFVYGVGAFGIAHVPHVGSLLAGGIVGATFR
ncbi:rhomboid family intramembrane serine protease [Halobacterium rubrum]|uniref:rhomboid family intramembrane serine protease n=1 Tax=Halobacterium TaxID=2239 RepID=UPI001F2E96E3|nr:MULTISPECIES: rhomboid family intramembrane serine protease [Halobacterium]MDH5018758.1 rhomboid family intramembrane serine protease [Halobacterium rubrum]